MHSHLKKIKLKLAKSNEYEYELYQLKLDSFLQMSLSILKLKSLYLQEFATSKVEVRWRELGVFRELSQLQVFSRNNISTQKNRFYAERLLLISC
jgi:hypothetical protein